MVQFKSHFSDVHLRGHLFFGPSAHYLILRMKIKKMKKLSKKVVPNINVDLSIPSFLSLDNDQAFEEMFKNPFL